MLPRTCNPGSLADRGEHLRGVLPPGALPRFRQAVDHAGGPVRVSLDFARDEAGLARVSGRLEVSVRLTCRRCLEPLDLLLEATLDVLAGGTDEEGEWREQGRELLQTRGDLLLLHDLIEDELILALPMHPSHPRGRCSAPAGPASRAGVPAAAPRSPFAALADLIDPPTARGTTMAVSQRKKATSRRDMRRAHQALRSPALSEDPTTGEKHLRHHVSPDGYYRGRKVLETGDD